MPLLTKLYQNIVLIQGFKKSKNKFSPYKQFELAYANAEDIHLAEKSLHVNKAKGAIGISAKFVKMLSVRIFRIISTLKMLICECKTNFLKGG